MTDRTQGAAPAARWGLPPRALGYITTLAVIAGTLSYLGGRTFPMRTGEVGLTVFLALGAAVAQLSEVRTPNNKAYVATVAFLLAAALLLTPVAAATVAATAFVVEQAVKRKKLYIQVFNIGSQILCTLAASATYHAISGAPVGVARLPGDTRTVLGVVGAVVAFLALNHATVTAVLGLARGVRPRDTGLFAADSLLTDLGLLALGVVVAELWSLGPALTAFALVPLVLLQRALHFPSLRQASRTDAKTGLANAAWFTEQAEEELRRAARIGTGVAVLVADLDLLRNINNAYGHLAGDVVLKGVADVLLAEVREYDVPSRFGGEEFAVLLPAASEAEALAVAERIRLRVARERYEVSTSVRPLNVTVSIGVSTLGGTIKTLKDLLHAADLALYRAKVEGRDRVRVAGPGDTATEAPAAALAMAYRSQPLAPGSRLLGGTAPQIDDDSRASTDELTAAGPAAEHLGALRSIRDASSGTSVGSDRGFRAARRPSALGRDEAAPGPAAAAGVRVAGATATPATPRGRTWPVTVIATLAAAAALPLVVLAHPHVSIAALCVFPLLALAAELLGEDIYGSSSVSLSAVPVLAAIAAGLAVPAVVAALVSGLASTSAGRSRRLEQWLFNPANLVLAATAAAGARLAVPLPAHIRTALPFLLPLMVVIALGYFLLDNGLVALVVARDERRRAADVFQHDLAWLAPHFGAYGLLGALLGAAWQSFGVWGLAVFLLPLALVRLAQQQYLGRTASHVSELRRLAEDLHVSKTEVEATNAALQVALRSVSEAHRQTATALAGAIDARDAITGGHIERVAALGVALCEVVDPALASDPQVAFGFLLHDVGKIGVPDAVLLKPGPLDSHEQDIMRKHPEIGERLVTSAGFAPVAREIVATHHERWDGAGYPQGLSGTQIPLCSRLFSVADALDAMVSDRPYRRGMPLARAFDELRGSTGSQFDPMAVEAVLSLDPERVAQLLRLHEPGRRKSQLRAVND